MQRKLHFMVSASAASVLAFSALAQDNPHLNRNDSSYALGANRPKDAAKASDVIGKTVVNNQDEKLGKVNDLAVDLESGRIIQVILATGGFIGLGDTLTAVPPQALQCDATHKDYRLDASKEKLLGAPKFEKSSWAACCDSNYLAAVYNYYGETPAFNFIQGDKAVSNGQPNKVSTHKTDGTSASCDCMIPVARLSQVQKASKLMGATVRNMQDEKVGHVENMLLDMPAGRVVAVIVASGGFLGLGDELSAVPPTALRFTSNRAMLQLDTTKEMLASAPHFKADQWPDFSESNYATVVYQAYHVKPYYATNATVAADNTAVNIRDRHDRTLTPLDQGQSQADINTTAQIRRAIIAAEDISVDGRNVKIITTAGRVTLRGPVKNAEEKKRIGDIAGRIAQTINVDNQLEVKLTASNN